MNLTTEQLHAAARALEAYGMEPVCGMASAARREDAFRSAAYRVVDAVAAAAPPVRERALVRCKACFGTGRADASARVYEGRFACDGCNGAGQVRL